jgi:peptidoglycan-associated lipoprotein
MSIRIKILLTAILILTIGLESMAQQKDIRMADSAFQTLQYYSAADYYQRAINKFKENTAEKQYSMFMLAECYRIMNDPDQALPFYKELVELNYGASEPSLYLRYAQGLKTNGEVAAAKEYFEKYLSISPSDKEALTGLESCRWIIDNQARWLQVNVVNLEDVNSPQDDFGPVFLDEEHSQIVFTSNRYNEKTKSWDEWSNAPFSDLYTSTFKGKRWSDPAPLEFLGKINSDVHEGSPCVNHDRSAIYFTRCDKAATDMAYCQIWKSERSENGWKTPKLVLSDSMANIGQPTLSRDGLTLLFSSDKKGSKGENDIWAVARDHKDSTFGKPFLLQAVNSIGDEVFPYLYNDTTLYFSSDGFEGYGGWDIYRSVKRKGSWSSPENLLTPVNSGYDDFGIIVRIPGEEGFFSSNRPGGLGGDDIYRFYRKILLFSVTGQIKDNMNLLPLQDVQVMLVEDDKDTSVCYTDKRGQFSFDTSIVKEDHTYELIFRKTNYFAKKDNFSTWPYKEDFAFTVDANLEPIPEKPIVLPDILYELDKWDLAPQYQDSLMQLVVLLKENESLVIELRSHTDSRGSDEYNDILSQKRAQSVVDFLISQGIDPGRLVAKGYGERIYRVLDKSITREKYTFKAGTEISDEFVNSLPSKEIKEAAFQLNRRTEFTVLAKDFKPGTAAGATPVIQVVSDPSARTLSYALEEDGRMTVNGYINDFSTGFIIDPGSAGSFIDGAMVLDLLQKGAIDRTDFEKDLEEVIIDGQVMDNARIKLEKIRLGENVIHDAWVSVRSDSNTSFILGKDLLDQIGSFLIDEDNRVIIFK